MRVNIAANRRQLVVKRIELADDAEQRFFDGAHESPFDLPQMPVSIALRPFDESDYAPASAVASHARSRRTAQSRTARAAAGPQTNDGRVRSVSISAPDTCL